MSYTHICIKTATSDCKFKLKQGDFGTLKTTEINVRIKGGVGLIFKEDVETVYASHLFVELPPQQQKIVYVAVSEEVKETILEPMLN